MSITTTRGRLTLQDSDFIDGVESDVRAFVKNRSEKRVLVFPPVNNYRRFLIHKVIEEEFQDLKTFSIGEGDNRRTVICYKKDYIDPQVTSLPVVKKNCLPPRQAVGRVLSRTISSDSETAETSQKPKRARTMPSVNIYRPPAARKLEQNANTQNRIVNNTEPETRCKYIEECEEVTSATKRTETSGISMFRSAISSIRSQSQVPKISENSEKKVEDIMKPEKVEKVALKNSNTIKQRRPDMQVYVPKGRRIAEGKTPKENGNKPSVKEKPSPKTQEEVNNINNMKNDNGFNGTITIPKLVESEVPCSENKTEDDNHAPTQTSLWIEAQNNIKSEPKVINSSRPYEDSDSTVVSSSDNSSSNSLRNSCEKISEIKEVNKGANSVQLNPDECDWETMYDENGECLDPSLLEQLSTAVGEVTIEKPKSNYTEFKTKSLDTVADEFPHVIEIYNFPPEFKLQDLMTVFSDFKNSGFEIKWVDDTHALGIFPSKAIVAEVLNFHHPFVKTRSLKEGTSLSKTKARRSAEFLLPYKPRPDTCPALARRLVTGALGVKLPTSREEREAEKKILTKAREKKKLEAKQKEDAWEGTFS